MSTLYHKIAVGGTFDRLHLGHKRLLQKTFDLGAYVVVGITSDSFFKNKAYATSITSLVERQSSLISYFEENGYAKRYQIILLDDIFGTTLEDDTLEAIVVTTDTAQVAGLINSKRIYAGKQPLAIEMVPLFDDQSNIPLLSSRIREGIVNSEGLVYSQVFQTNLRLTPEQLKELKKPMDLLVTSSRLDQELAVLSPSVIALVGDITLQAFLKKKLPFNYGIYDGINNRKQLKKYNLPDWTQLLTDNPSGTITHNCVDQITRLLQFKQGLLKVNGEEDLLVLVFILFLPLNSIVLYGQPEEGMVIVRVTEAVKERWYRFLQRADKIL